MRRTLTIVLLSVCALSHVHAQPQEEAEGGRRVVERVVPAYPELARRLNLVGVVKLRVTVAADGSPKLTEVLGGNPVLAKAAQDALPRWRWAPAPRETQEVVELRFHPK